MKSNCAFDRVYESPVVELLCIGEEDLFTASISDGWTPWY